MNKEKVEEFSWSKSFNKSLIDNSQLVFSKKIAISTINWEENIPCSEIVDIRELSRLEEVDYFIGYMDSRTIFYNCVKQNALINAINFFPLSREKYKLNCLVLTLDSEGLHCLTDKIEGFLKVNYKYNKIDGGICLTEEEYIYIAKERIDAIINTFKKLNKESSLNEFWAKLNSEEKLNYESIDKDSIKTELKIQDDVDKFVAQEEIKYSQNFSVIFLVPLDVEHSIFPMPQVVANARRPNFESLMKPHKKPRKFLFFNNFVKSEWKFKELNI